MPQRFQHVSAHDLRTAEDRQRYMHHHTFLVFCQRWHIRVSRYVAHVLERRAELGAKDLFVEIECLLGLPHKVQIDTYSCHFYPPSTYEYTKSRTLKPDLSKHMRLLAKSRGPRLLESRGCTF